MPYLYRSVLSIRFCRTLYPLSYPIWHPFPSASCFASACGFIRYLSRLWPRTLTYILPFFPFYPPSIQGRLRAYAFINAGDITNLVGCILTHQLPFQTYLATYFVFVDVSLVTQYFYYYKPPIPYSPSPSPSPSPTLTLTPTAVLYSSRSLTRPHSRSRLLERSINELEAGYGLHARARSAPRAGTGSARFSGVMYAYPPTGFLPTSDLAASGSDAVKFHRADHRPSLSSLKRRLGEGSEKAEAKTAVRTRDRIGSFSEDSAQERDKEERGGEEEEELPSALVDSFYSDISGPLTGRHVSWGRDTAHPRHTSAPAVPVTAGGADTGASGSGEATETGFSTPTQTLGASKEEIRQRSRSRGRPSTRTRAYPTITYDFAPSTSQGTIQPLPPRGVPEGLAPYGDPGSSARAHRELELGRQRQSQSHSKSGSRRRTASIVFLSVGLGALLAFGSEPSTTMTTTMKTTAAVDLQDGIANVRGRVLGWNAVTDRGRHEDSVWQQNEPSFIYVQHEEPEADRRKHRPHARPPLTPEQKRRIIGRISAWSCTTLYLTSRLPQIWKNVSICPFGLTETELPWTDFILFYFLASP